MNKFTFHLRWRWALCSAAADLWPYVSDTDRFNRVAGFPAPVYTEEPLPEGGTRRMARLRKYGVTLAWYDAPFEWVQGREFTSERYYSAGPLRYTRTVARLDPRPDGGTDLTYEIWARPGNVLGYLGIPVQFGLIQRPLFERAFRRIDAYVQAHAPEPFASRRSPVSSTGNARLREFAGQLGAAGIDAGLVNHLIKHIRSAPDDRLTRMRPFAFADAWHTDRYATLELFLQASRLGLLDLSWDMICPECRGAKQQVPRLQEVAAHNHCSSCNIDFAVDFARSVEATFQVNPMIKLVLRQEYCIGGPQNTPHILAQQVLAPGETRSLTLPLPEAHYRWRAPRLAGNDPTARTVAIAENPAGGRVGLEIRPQAEAGPCPVDLTAAGLRVGVSALPPGLAVFTLHNATDREQIFLLEKTDWSDQASTAATVTSLQAFRDLFSSEALRPGESISVESLTLLFTDLKGSTLLYRTVGDAPAFGQVMAHFDLLRAGVAAHHGGLVKTIGDAIMAVFTDPADAVAAALDILDRFRVYNDTHPERPLLLKMGMHCGPCIAVTLNDRLDYFGSVVNIAARLEGQSEGDDLVLSAAVANDSAVDTLLMEQGARIVPFVAYLKGFAEPFSLRRVTLAGAVPALVAAGTAPVFLSV